MKCWPIRVLVVLFWRRRFSPTFLHHISARNCYDEDYFQACCATSCVSESVGCCKLDVFANKHPTIWKGCWIESSVGDDAYIVRGFNPASYTYFSLNRIRCQYCVQHACNLRDKWKFFNECNFFSLPRYYSASLTRNEICWFRGENGITNIKNSEQGGWSINFHAWWSNPHFQI